MAADPKRVRVDVLGVVQGVGFRPFVWDLATNLALTGWVANTSEGVTIEAQGPAERVDAFTTRLVRQAPPLAFVLQADNRPRPLESEAGFTIRPSHATEVRAALLPPDASICDDCRRELLDPSDRRYRYPFINCTNCGPRYTIIDDIPYDRDKTTMGGFPMCEACRREYEDPRDRRFHAQPNACPDCGPRVWLADASGKDGRAHDPIRSATNRLAQGEVLAVKGLGGFHVAVDATNAEAVRTLRHRKRREEKPLAVMCRDLSEARCHARIGAAAQEALESRHRPIVLVPRRQDSPLASEVAPDNPDIGIMLPYTPLHVLLLGQGPAALVMTSGNLSEEPICIDNDEAVRRLGGIADAFLMHDRDILVRNDDSVLRAGDSERTFLRRSRGYVPLPIVLGAPGPAVLAVGAELKNTVCVTKGKLAFVSQHIGDQANEAAFDAFEDTVRRLQRILDVRPELLATDMHPDYATTRWAKAQDLPREAVQHHHAHVASCLAEHCEPGPVIGLALDGTGYGTDGAVWGGELLVADLRSFERMGHLEYVRMPGGDQAARQPWRMALSYLMSALGQDWRKACSERLPAVPESRREGIAQLVNHGFQAPETSSTGRLFDGVAALCGLFLEAHFEAQAAMGLEMAARSATHDDRVWTVEIDRNATPLRIPTSVFVRPVVEDLAAGVPVPVVAMRFHRTLVHAWVLACRIARERTGIETVATSGGSMQNGLLSSLLTRGLEAEGFRVLRQRSVPPNDGGIALGQAVVAQARRPTPFAFRGLGFDARGPRACPDRFADP